MNRAHGPKRAFQRWKSKRPHKRVHVPDWPKGFTSHVVEYLLSSINEMGMTFTRNGGQMTVSGHGEQR